ncbi:unnamed protein product [Caretta caretta]
MALHPPCSVGEVQGQLLVQDLVTGSPRPGDSSYITRSSLWQTSPFISVDGINMPPRTPKLEVMKSLEAGSDSVLLQELLLTKRLKRERERDRDQATSPTTQQKRYHQVLKYSTSRSVSFPGTGIGAKHFGAIVVIKLRLASVAGLHTVKEMALNRGSQEPIIKTGVEGKKASGQK